MSEPWVTIDIPGTTAPLVFRTKEAMQAWFDKEIEKWRWLWQRDDEPSALNRNHFSSVQQHWSQGVNFVRMSENEADNNLRNWINSHIRSDNTNRIIVSDTLDGKDILKAKEIAGVSAARWVYLSKIQAVPVNQSLHTADVRGLVLSAFPQLAGPEKYREVLQAERRNYREEVRRLQNSAEQYQADRVEEWRYRLRRASRLARKLTSRTTDRWNEGAKLFGNQAMDAIASINQTHDAYTKMMALAAPVTYWKEKADSHKKSEGRLLYINIGYFVLAMIALFFVVRETSKYILSLPKDVDRAAVYVIVSGGLIAFTTMMFWIGRLIVKFYLSEHHLRIDAEERSTMTKTYLAMTHEGSATEAERAIVLSAIFRPTPDGIVKEDGPVDLSVGGVFSKFLANPR